MEEHLDKTKATFLNTKNVCSDVWYLIKNPTRRKEIWNALHHHYSSLSKRNIQISKRALRDTTVESCFFDIETYLHKKADAIDALTHLDVNVDDN